MGTNHILSTSEAMPPLWEVSDKSNEGDATMNMQLWALFERNTTACAATSIWANTKADAEYLAFVMFNRPMDVDLMRGGQGA